MKPTVMPVKPRPRGSKLTNYKEDFTHKCGIKTKLHMQITVITHPGSTILWTVNPNRIK